MPELPEVETIRQQLEPRVVGATIADAGAHWSDKFSPALDAVGTEIVSARRRGKYLLFDLDPGADGGPPRELVVHLGMTGRLAVHEPGSALALDDPATEPHLRAWWRFTDGRTFTFHDTRRFGRIKVVDAGDYRTLPTLDHLGPEPWDPAFTGRVLAAFVKRSNRHLKTILLTQRAVAGVGNIYADEALWMAKINPATRRLSVNRADRLVETIRTALQSGLDHGGTTLRDYVDSDGSTGANQHELHCYGRSGSPCHRCATELRSRVLDARTTTYCPTCQAR
ncbi:MAG: bifunctional DNA-formamidopyrimidine glycosylase/DNA-(apurinic or apyrimidinic site) lyase [Ilumatobacteraceae bacterium]